MKSQVRFHRLFQPGQVGKVTIKNRIVMSPLGTTFWGVNGEVTDRIIDHYAARAKGGAGLITVSFASFDYPPGYKMLANFDSWDKYCGHYTLVEKVHAYGARLSLQLQHVGRQRMYERGIELVSSSPVRCAMLGESTYPIPRSLERGEIYEIMDRFATLAAAAKHVGYDMVEVHGAHGYLVNSFMSPYLNTRSDEFGGSLKNRMRFPTELIRRIKEVTGDDYPVGIRINGDEFVEGGITTEESPIMAQMLEEAGAAFVHISSGIYETLHKSNDIMRMPEGWKSYIWEAVKDRVRGPTFAAGGLRTPEFCEKLLADSKADFVALGRQLLADPEWPNKAMEGRVDDIRKCTSCLECMGVITGRALDTRCALNVAVGREKEFGEIKPAPLKRKVVIIGAGPGGMEAARVSALRGHKVTLYDEKGELGGQLLLAASPPGKAKLIWYRDYQATQLAKLNVRLQLGVKVTPALVKKDEPEAVIIATGGEPIALGIPVVKDKKVSTAWEVLKGETKIKNRKVIIAGGGMVGAETAEFLAEQGNTVTIVEILPRIAEDMEPHNRRGLMEALKEKKIAMLTEHEVSEVTGKGLMVFDRKHGERKLIEGDWIILAMGAKSATELTDALMGKNSQVYVVGDCKQPRTIMAAVYEGAFSALQIQ